MESELKHEAQLPPCPFSGAPAELWLPLGSTEWLLTCVEKDCICSLLGGCPDPDWMREAWSRRSGKQWECPTCAHTPESYAAAAHTGQAQPTHDQARDIATQILDGTHCPKHGMAWEECCLGEVSLELACKIIAALKGETFSHFSLAAPAVAGESERCVNHCEHDPKWAGMSQDGLIARCLLAAFDIKRKGEAASRPTPSAVRRAAEIYTKIEPYIEWEKVAMATCADGKTTPQFITELIEAELTKES